MTARSEILMSAQAFVAWRRRSSLCKTRAAIALGVNRATINGWESEARPIPPAVMMACFLIDHGIDRFKVAALFRSQQPG